MLDELSQSPGYVSFGESSLNHLLTTLVTIWVPPLSCPRRQYSQSEIILSIRKDTGVYSEAQTWGKEVKWNARGMTMYLWLSNSKGSIHAPEESAASLRYQFCIFCASDPGVLSCPHNLIFQHSIAGIFKQCAARMFKTCNTWLVSQGHWPPFP